MAIKMTQNGVDSSYLGSVWFLKNGFLTKCAKIDFFFFFFFFVGEIFNVEKLFCNKIKALLRKNKNTLQN